MSIRLLTGLAAVSLLFDADAAPQTEPTARDADLRTQDARINTNRRTGRVRVIRALPQAPLAVPSVNDVSRADFVAMLAVEHYGLMFGMTNPRQELLSLREKAKRRGSARHCCRQPALSGVAAATGQWARPEVPASVVSLDGAAISGMAFSLSVGRAA